MKWDGLHQPLGLGNVHNSGKEARRKKWALASGCAVVLACAAGVFVGFAKPHEPTLASARIELAASPSKQKPEIFASEATSSPPALNVVSGGGSVRTEHGVRVVSGGSSLVSIIRAPSGRASHLATAPDPGVSESTKYGILPIIGRNGAQPFNVYKRPIGPTAAGRVRPRIALVITGLGLDPALTRDAIRQLPPEVTLGFAPIRDDVARLAAKARREGHEILLQTPMEPLATNGSRRFPHELTTEASARENIRNLRWQMGRLQDYFGLMNYLGAKLTSDGAALSPILQEVANRGLAYFDDGSSAQSLAPEIAFDMHIPVGRADIVLDAQNDPDATAAALDRLVALARARGQAIGVAAGLPRSIDAVASFARTLKSRGISLVPVSALLSSQTVVSANSGN